MQSEFTEDQEQFRQVVARFLQDKSTPIDVRRCMETDSGYEPDVWRQLSNEVGLTGTHLPEEYGGHGFGAVELGITCEEMGRSLYCGPFLSSAVMAGYALLEAGEESAKQRLLPDISSGETIATLVLDDLNSPDNVGTSISASGGQLSGRAPLVVDAQSATVLIIIAGSGLYLVSREAAGILISPVQALDPTRKLASVEFDGTPAEKIGEVTTAALSRIWDHICVALSHEMIGGAQHLLETTIEYTKIRYQFGRPIGSFQALKHRLADLLMEIEFARAATHHAAFCLASDEGEPYAPSMAKALASDTYLLAAKEAIQMRGGIGFTWEEDTHLWFKRAKASEVFMGTPSMHRERMMSQIEAEG